MRFEAIGMGLLSTHFVPLGLTEEEIDLLTEFLASSLRDPALTRSVPVAVLSGSCFPNNDPASRRELGCPWHEP